MNKTYKAYFSQSIKQNLNNPLFYISSFIFTVFIYYSFFIQQSFFSQTGTSNLLLFFSKIPYVSIIIIPVLCFKKSSSVYDLFIPVSFLKKIIFNFLSILIIYSVQLLLLLPAVFCVNIFGAVDFGQVFTSIFVLILYGAALISFTLFINELFENKIISLFVNIIIQAVINSIHLVVVYINLPDFLIRVFKQFSFAWHFNSASKGILDSRDVFWFLCCTVFFILSANFIKLKKNGIRFSGIQKSRISAIVLLILLTMINSSRIYKKLDFSADKTFSFSKYTKNLQNKINSPLKITYYRSSTLHKLYPQISEVTDYLSAFSAQNKNISLQIKDPDKNSDIKNLLENYNISSQSFKTIKNTSVEYIDVYSAITLEYEGKIQVISFLMGTETLEYDLTSRINSLISQKERNVNIILGNGMNFYSDYSYIISWLTSQGFTATPIFIQDPDFLRILENRSGPLLVIGDTQIDVEKAIAIENYILTNKGNALFNISPFSADISGNWAITPNKQTNLVEMLENWGIKFTNDFVADISCATITLSSDEGDSNPISNNTQVLNYPLWVNLLSQENCTSGATLFWPVNLLIESENAKPYFVSSPGAYLYTMQSADENGSIIPSNPFDLLYDNITNKNKGTYILGAEITGKINGYYNLASTDSAKIIVIPDQYFINTLMTNYIGNNYSDYRNFDLTTNILLQLNNENELAQLHLRSLSDKSLYKITDLNKFLKLELITFIILFVIEPLFIFITFLIVHNILRKKNEIK